MKTAQYILPALAAVFLGLTAFSAQAAPATSYYVYDEAGHVIGEYDQNGNPVQEHIYLGDRPVAVVQGGNASDISYVTTDQLNTPRAVTDSNQDVEWSWSSDPFGNNQPTGSLTYNLRFPGQYYDQETGHNYNFYRDYNPSIGRYIESDPVGLSGGMNTYAYGLDSPVTNDDPFGLLVLLCSRKLGSPNAPSLPGDSSWPLRHEYLVVNGVSYSFQPTGSELLSPGQVLHNEKANSQCTKLCDDPKFDAAVLDAIRTIGAPMYCLIAVGGQTYHGAPIHNCQTWAQDVLDLAKQNYLKDDKCPKCFKGNN